MARVIGAADGILVGDQRRDQVLNLSDKTGDGDAADAGETTVFFDAANASGLETPTGNIFAVHQGADGSVFVGDGDAVFRLRDRNADGDAQDAGEAAIWFGADNAGGLPLVTPNGIAEGPDGAIYVTNAGVLSTPADAIYRTIDLNGDGDAQDAGEATVWLDLQTVVPTSVPFDISFDGAIAYVNDYIAREVFSVIRASQRKIDWPPQPAA